MLTYQYQCPNNGEVLEVRHRMSERIETWGELCARLERELGATPAAAPVERVISGGLMASVNGGTARSTEMNLPIAGGCCGSPSSCRHHG
jgi:hypothetical protein